MIKNQLIKVSIRSTGKIKPAPIAGGGERTRGCLHHVLRIVSYFDLFFHRLAAPARPLSRAMRVRSSGDSFAQLLLPPADSLLRCCSNFSNCPTGSRTYSLSISFTALIVSALSSDIGVYLLIKSISFIISEL